MTITQQFNESIANNGFDFYSLLTIRYIEADEHSRKESKDHWLRCHAENVASGREDMIVFTSKILAAISLAEAITEEHKTSWQNKEGE